MSADSGLLTLSSASPIPDGTVQSVSVNTRLSIDPESSAQHNPNYAGANLFPGSVVGRAPWIFPLNLFGWAHVTDYCGSVYCTSYGEQGSILQYGDAGHSAGGPSIWARYDVATAQWTLVGRALPTDSLQSYVAGSNPPATRFDHTWGDWIGGSNDWPIGWRQPGFNPPAGSHTRSSFFYRPPRKAGNLAGQVVATWQPTGKNGGTGCGGSFYFDLDSGLWHRTRNLRPNAGSSQESIYYEPNDIALAVVMEFSHFADAVYVLDCATMTWSKRPVTGSVPWVISDSTQFICGGLLVVVIETTAANDVEPMAFFAMPIEAIVSGIGMRWTKLKINAASYPVSPMDGIIRAMSISWNRFSDGHFYATNLGYSPHTLWKLIPPAGNDVDKLLGTWLIGTQVLVGDEISRSSRDFSRLQYVPAIDSFLWTGDDIGGPVQAIRPRKTLSAPTGLAR